ncbi:MAG: histidinol dehydrogenase [Thermoplasmata archaeon]
MIPIVNGRDRPLPELRSVLERRRPRSSSAPRVARRIVESVRQGGDSAVADWQERLGGVRPRPLRLDRREIRRGRQGVDPALLRALSRAHEQIRRFHERQLSPGFELRLDRYGSRAGQRRVPLDRAGIYVPGGPNGYPSSVLMGAVPARLAGVREIVVATPPAHGSGGPPASVLAAADLAGVSEILVAGGAQAIAALAYGTETIRPVDRIVGPGNAYVTAAKLLCQDRTAIDGIAGPSEVVVLADESCPPEWVAAELIAQAEHASDAWGGAILIGGASARGVQEAVRDRLRRHPRSRWVHATLRRYSWIVTGLDRADAIDLTNQIAPEHLALAIRRSRSALGRIRAAGCVFVGPQTPVPMGDYGAATNHILPTLGSARARGALGVADFLRTISYLELDARYVVRRAAPAIRLARSEGFTGHAEAIKARQPQAGGDP